MTYLVNFQTIVIMIAAPPIIPNRVLLQLLKAANRPIIQSAAVTKPIINLTSAFFPFILHKIMFKFQKIIHCYPTKNKTNPKKQQNSYYYKKSNYNYFAAHMYHQSYEKGQGVFMLFLFMLVVQITTKIASE